MSSREIAAMKEEELRELHKAKVAVLGSNFLGSKNHMTRRFKVV